MKNRIHTYKAPWLLAALIVFAAVASAGVYNNTLVQVIKTERCSASIENQTLELVPEARIIIPSPESDRIYGESVTFAAVSAWEEYGECDYGHIYEWKSDLDGIIGEQTSFTADWLSVGYHRITFSVIDGCGNVLTDETNITVRNLPLEADITSPGSEEAYPENERITLECSVKNGVEPYTYQWSVDGGVVGTAETASFFLTPGLYLITLNVSDSAGERISKSRYLPVVAAGERIPAVLGAGISSPNEGDIYDNNDIIRFDGGAAGGSQPYYFEWLDAEGNVVSREQAFSVINATVSTKILEEGIPHKFTLLVRDTKGRTAEDSVSITIKSRCKVDGVCYSNENYVNCPQDCPTGSQDGICDKKQDQRCDPDCAGREDPDCLCVIDGFCETDFEDYLNCPQDCPTGSQDGICDKKQDQRCDPDCTNGEDPDCSTTDWGDYLVLLILVAIIYIVFQRLRKASR